jgi:D-3-phosphoglycerate dehydrogenase
MAEAGVNISEMASKSKGDYAYTMLDLDSPATTEAVEKIKALDDVIKVRIVK